MQFPKGMLKFVSLYLDAEPQLKIQKECSVGGKYYNENSNMFHVYFILLLRDFINTEFQDQTYYKKVKDLPEGEILSAIECLGYLLGMNKHNGNEHPLNMIQQYGLKLQDM